MATMATENANGNGKPPTGILKEITKNLKVIPNVLITPDMARELLTLNTSNRPFMVPVYQRYLRDMKAGKWVFSGNMIKFSSDKVMRDGQHSLTALIDAETPQIFNIQTGLDPSTFNVMDTGRQRSGGDVLAIKGYEHYNILAAAIKNIIFYEKNNKIKNNLRMNAVTNDQVDEWSSKPQMKLLEKCFEFVYQFRMKDKKGVFMSAATWSFVHYILAKRNRDQATEFITRLAYGEDISMKKDRAIYLLREQLSTFNFENIKALVAGGSTVTEMKVRYIIRSWNAWQTSENIAKLSPNFKDDQMEKLV